MGYSEGYNAGKQLREVILKNAEILKKIDSFKDLKENWDSYGSEKIKSTAIRLASHFVNQCSKNGLVVEFVVPMSSGNIQMEWGNNLELEIYSNGNVGLCLFDDDCNVIMDDIDNSVDDVIQKILSLLKKKRKKH